MNLQQVKQLSNLLPSTVINLEGVSFENRAYALPGVVDASESISDVEFVAEDKFGEIDVSKQLRLKPDTCERMVVTNKYVVVGGLCYDDDGEHVNPLEEECANGNIFHHGRRAWKKGEEASFFDAMGFDGEGNQALNAESVSDELLRNVSAIIRKNRSLMSTLSNLLRNMKGQGTWDLVIKRIGDAIYQEGWEYAPDYIATYFLDVSWWIDVDEVWKDKLEPLIDLLSESEAEKAWERAVSAGKMGNPLAVMLDIYEHSGVWYSVSGGGMQCAWDTSRGGAVWVPDEDATDNIRYNVLHQIGIGKVEWRGSLGSNEYPLNAQYSLDDGLTWVGDSCKWSWRQAMDEMLLASGQMITKNEMDNLMYDESVKHCKSLLKEYNAWVNGEVYGVVVYTIDRETGESIDSGDECWGYIGTEYAEETLESNILETVVRLASATH
jgi:hypothetical protein